MQPIPQGAISEVFGAVSSGKTLFLYELLANYSAQNEFLAVIDARDAFDPLSAGQAGVNLRRLLWIRTHGHVAHALKAADLILHAGGFGLVILDLSEVALRDLNRIPLSYWYRFRLAVQNTPTRLIVTGDQALVKSCARVQLEVKRQHLLWRGSVLEGIDFAVAPRKALRIAG